MKDLIMLYQNKRASGIIMLMVWIIFAVTYMLIDQAGNKVNYLTGILSLLGQVVLDVVAFLFSLLLYKKTICRNTKRLFFLFAASFLCAAIADSSYNIIFNTLHIPQTFSFYSSIWEIPFLGFLIFQGLAWYDLILFFNRTSIVKGGLIAYIMLSLVSVTILYIYFFQVNWQVIEHPIISFYHVSDTIVEVASIIAVFICLMISRNNSLGMMAIGYLIIIASDLVIRHDVIIQNMNYGSYFEVTWVLGLLLFIYAQAQLLSQKDFNHFSKLNVNYNTVHFKIVLGGLSIGILSLFLFFILLYFFSPIKTIINDQLLKNVPSFLIIYSVLSIVMANLFASRISLRFKAIEKLIKQFMKSQKIILPESHKEKIQDTMEFSQLYQCILKAISLRQDKRVAENKLTQTVKRVSHDIHSPLVSIEMVLKDTDDIPEPKRLILHNAIFTIKSILSNLSIDHLSVENNKTFNERDVQLVSHVLGSIVSEKKLQYMNKDISFDYLINNQTYNLFANIELCHFTRVISNIINNAVEAIDSNGSIKIVLEKRHKYILIKVIDTGCGIFPKELIHVFQEGVSYRKQSGSGMGLAIVNEYIKKWGGSCEITSKVGYGTIVTIRLPTAQKPDWFQPELVLLKQSTVIILDDDSSIHSTWREKLNYWIENNNIDLICYKKIEDFESYIEEKSTFQYQKCYFLIDYEMLNSSITGVELINKYQLNDFALLVTNYGGDLKIQKTCLQNKIKMIPKNYVSYIPIKFIETRPDLILLDNTQTILDSWKFMAKQRNHCIVTFNNISDFKKYIKTCHSEVKIYIDYDLGGAYTGDQILHWLFTKGYHNLYLLTGYESTTFSKMPWIKQILPKYYPL